MKIITALELLNLSYGPHKPLEVDRAFAKAKGRTTASNSSSSSQQTNDNDVVSLDASALPLETTMQIWESLVSDWVYLSDEEVNKFPVKTLCEIRRRRLLNERADDFNTAIEMDYPNRVKYNWDAEEAFGDIDALLTLERMKAEADELVSETIVRAKIARARFRALYIDPTLLWIEGTYLEEKDEGRLHNCSAISYRNFEDGYYYLDEDDHSNCFRLRYPREIEYRLNRISEIYGKCGIVNALRLIILNAGIGFNEFGRIFEYSLANFELSGKDLCKIADSIIKGQFGSEHLPFGDSQVVKISNGEQRRRPFFIIPKSQREILVRADSVLGKLFPNERDLHNALVELRRKYWWSMFGSEYDEFQMRTYENMLRAICELDGEDPRSLGIGSEVLSPIGEAHDCLMREPGQMAPNLSPRESEALVDEFNEYKQSKRKHKTSFEQWRYMQFCSTFNKVKSTLKVFASYAFATAFILGMPITLVTAVLLSDIFDFSGDRLPYFLIIPAIVVGLLAALWNRLSWPANVWWDRKISGINQDVRWLIELRVLGSTLVAAVLGSCIGSVVGAVLADIVRPYTSLEFVRAFIITFAAIACLLSIAIHYPRDWRAIFEHKHRDNYPERSGWEKLILSHVKSKFPSLEIETNDRSIIRSRDRFFGHYEIDIWIPELALGIEANGEKYHDHEQYNRDLRDGTEYSREMYKEKYCKKMGIKLVHVWSSESIGEVFDKIDYEIGKRLL